MKDFSSLREEILRGVDCSLFLEGRKVQPEFFPLKQGDTTRVCAIDGGSSPVLVSPGLCVFFVRIARVYMNPKHVVLEDGFVVVEPKEDNNELFVLAKFFSTDGLVEKLFFEPISAIGDEATLEKAGGIARKILEWRAVNKAQKDDCLVLWDGCFTTTNDVEKNHKPEGACVGVAKSTGAMGSWRGFQKSGLWAARVDEKTFFVKLHDKSKHVLRVDTNNKELLDLLVPWSCDPVFLGYPYPLVVADELARVSFAHTQSVRAQLQSIIGKSWDEVSFGEQDAHSILDSIKF